MQYVLIKPATGAKTSESFKTDAYQHLVASADALASTETVTVNVIAGSTAVAYCDESGTAVTLTASVPSTKLPGGPTYQFVKAATTGACGVYADLSALNS